MTKEKKDLITLAVGKVLQVLIALVSIKILTEVLSTQEVGNYYLLLTVLTLFNFTFLNPLGQYYGRHLISWEKSNNLLNATIVLMALRILAIISALFFAYGVFIYFEYSKYYTLSEFLLFIFISLVAGTFLVLLSAVNTLGDRIKFIGYLISCLFIGLVLSLIMVYFLDRSAISWLYGIAIAQLVFLVPVYRYLVQNNEFSLAKIKATFNKKYIKNVSYFMIPITITLFLQWGQNISYRFIIEAKYSIEILAFIVVGFSVSGAIFSAVEGLATQYFNPIYLKQITNASKEERANAWNELANYIIPIYVLLALFVVALAPYLVQILVAEKFYDAYIYVMFGAIIEFFRVITNIVYMVSQSEIKTNTTMLPFAVGFLISIITLYLVDFSQTLWSIPIVLIVAYSTIFLMLFFNMKKLLPIHINFVSIGKALMLSVPFTWVYLLDKAYSLVMILSIIVVSGIYFVMGVYVLRPKEKKERLV